MKVNVKIWCILCVFLYETWNEGVSAITFGLEPEPNHILFTVSIQRNYVHICTGVIFGSVWVLTDSYCISRHSSHYTVVHSTAELLEGMDLPFAHVRTVIDRIPRQRGLSRVLPYDMGIIKVNVAFNPEQAMILELAPSDYPLPNEYYVQLVGWANYEVRTAPTMIVKRAVYLANSIYLPLERFPTSNSDTGLNTVSDRGAPIVDGDILLGIAHKCGTAVSPDEFIQVAKHYDWIGIILVQYR